MKTISLGIGALLLTASTAMATGPVVTPQYPVVVTPPAAPSWAGFYAGGSLGVGSANYDLGGRYTNLAPVDIALNLPDLGGQGGLFALQGGYNFQLSSRWVAGVQLDATVTNIANDTSLSVAIGANTLNASYDLTVRSMYTLGGRIGYLTSPDTLVYGLLGVSRGNFEGSYAADINGTPLVNGSYDFSLNGAAVGVGVETRLSDRTTLGLEYRYNHMERYSFYDGPALGGNLEVGFDTAVHTVRAMVNVHF
ncbi:MAG: outer membrane beta-barrel protein [Rhodobacteraceae bacterium]|jgi:outer membrane immunogenic protein|nr:outer membrane beta-barrel protein [Paracoccaceae bacterium]